MNMYIYHGFFPYMGGNKIPLHYYTLLYPQLHSVWEELVEYLRSIGAKLEIDKHNIVVKVKDMDADDVLAKLHSSYMVVEGYYDGELIDYNEYLRFLWKEYSVRYSSMLLRLADFVEKRDYERAYVIALEAIKEVAHAENLYARTGRRIDHMLFEMLNGGIPQTFINTYQLVSRNAPLVSNITESIYESLIESARRIGRTLKKNVELMDKVEKTSNIE